MRSSFPGVLSATVLAGLIATLALPAAAHERARSGGPDRATIRDLLVSEQARTDIFKVVFPNLQMARRAAITFHDNMLESRYTEGYLVMELNEFERERLEGLGFVIERADDWIRARNERLDVLIAAGGRGLLGKDAAGTEAIPGFTCYETVEETFAAMDTMVATYPQLASIIDAGDSWQKTQGSGGYDIKVLKLTNAAIGGDKPKLFINAAIHAREYTTAPLVLEFARQLTSGYGTNADSTWILDHHEVHLMLQTNPDGRKRAEAGSSWRKNTNQNYCQSISSLRGADLNRNFGYSWNSTGGQGSSGAQCDLTYRGPSPSSEPETKAIENYVRSLWPDRRGPTLDDPAPTDTSGIHLDIHSYSQLVLWPWGVRNAPAPNGTALQTLGRRFAWFNNYTPQQSIGLYPTDGTSDSISYGELGVAAFTFELGTDFFESCTNYTNTIKPNNIPALFYAAKVVRTPYITPGGPTVTGTRLSNRAATTGVRAGTPVTLQAAVTDSRFNNSEGTEPTQAIAAAEFYIDTPPWVAGATPVAMTAIDGSFNAVSENVTGTINTTGLSVGKHLVFVRSRDAGGTWGPVTASFLVIR
jgi:carboxypeptidase T